MSRLNSDTPLYKRIPDGYTEHMANFKEYMTVNEVRIDMSLNELTEEELVERAEYRRRQEHISRLQVQHEKTVQLIDDATELQDVIEKFDARIHWLDWNNVGNEGEPTIAMCGATIHDGKHWYSLAAWDDELSLVTCKECSELPEYNLKLLGQTDLGESNNDAISDTPTFTFSGDSNTGLYKIY